MAEFDQALYEQLEKEFKELCDKTPEEQADVFIARYILSGQDPNAIMDGLRLFKSCLPRDLAYGKFMDFTNHGFQNFLQQVGLTFDSALVRNQELAKLSPNPVNKPKTELSFIEYLIFVNKEAILQDFNTRWKRNSKIPAKNIRFMRQAVWQELLKEHPVGVDPELDDLILEEISFKEQNNKKIEKLLSETKAIEEKQAKGEMLTIKEKRALQELEIVRQGDLEGQLRHKQVEIRKRKNKIIRTQKQKMKQFKQGNFAPVAATNTAAVPAKVFTQPTAAVQQIDKEPPAAIPPPPTSEPPLPAGWAAYVDDSSGYTYYHNASTNETTWERPQ